MKEKIKFIDLFAGIGGFHQALKKMGADCVFASEINKDCQEIYKLNFPDTILYGDIYGCIDKIPHFDFLCAGFPCQPFSKAGKRKGFKDKNRGTLFFTLMKILKQHEECKYILLENVKNLADNKDNWETIQSELEKLDFYVNKEPIILSPHEFGVPQIRERLFIVGIKKKYANNIIGRKESIELSDLNLSVKKKYIYGSKDIDNVLDKSINSSYIISKKEKDVLSMWYKFKKLTNFERVGAPIWVEYFGFKMSDKVFNAFRDHNGVLFSEMPEWKQGFVRKNRSFYKKHKKVIDDWIIKYKVLDMPLVWQKFEWNCDEYEDIKNTIIQFRQSGIRVKRKNYFPTLVAINNTPIVYDDSVFDFRRITPKEASRLQSFNNSYKIINYNSFYKQIGNSVNVKIIYELSKSLLRLDRRN